MTRKHAWLFFFVALWNLVVWAQFAKVMLHTHGKETGYYVAHWVLIVVDLVIAAVLAVLGVKAWRTATTEKAGS